MYRTLVLKVIRYPWIVLITVLQFITVLVVALILWLYNFKGSHWRDIWQEITALESYEYGDEFLGERHFRETLKRRLTTRNKT